MRLLLTVTILAMAVAGCTAPADAPDPLFGVCPQWVDGDTLQGTLGTDAAYEADPASRQEHAGANRSLDRYRVVLSNLETDGVLELSATALDDGRTLRFTDARDPNVVRTPTFLVLDGDSGTVDVDILLSDITHGADADPTGIQLTVTGRDGATGTMDVHVTPGYRVCGAIV